MLLFSRLARRVACGVVSFGWVLACGGSGLNGPGSPSAGGDPEPLGNSSPKADVPDGPPRELDCGDFATCAIATDGLARCWGNGKEGVLGDGEGAGARPKRAVVPGIGKVRKVALASRFGCALTEDKTVKCWGTGRIANDGKVVSDAKPTSVAGVDDVDELVASGVIACARNARGVVCWGADEKTIGTPPPKATFKQIATGFTHACGLEANGSVTCWGAADWGPKGAYAKPGVTGALALVTGDRHGCVITKDRTVQCWGMNDAGQLGMKPDTEPHKKPVLVPGIGGAVKLVAGEASTCALLGDGSVLCWGANEEGELGLGTRSSAEKPAAVTSLSDVETICLASAHGCALTKGGQLLCWGANAYGQLADGTKERRSSPTPVVW